MNSYYETLGVNEQSSVDEIKKAYRKKAKQFHPDVNTSASAGADFIKVNEAYEYIINKKLGLSYDSGKQRYRASGNAGAEWSRAQQEAANQRANYYSQKRYKDFVNSKFYKESKLIEDFASYTGLLIYFTFIVIFPFTMSLFYDLPAFWISLFIAFLSVPGWGPLLMQTRRVPFSNIQTGAKLAFKDFKLPYAKQALCFLFFLVVFLTIGFRTLITIYEIIAYMLIIFFILFKVKKLIWKSENQKQITHTLAITALIFASLLCLNYFISFNAQEEEYNYNMIYYQSRGSKTVSSNIELHDDVYSQYPSIRFFFDHEDIHSADVICYRMKRGIFFYKVYTERYFK